MIGVDWGTTRMRAFRLDGRGVIDRTDAPDGILSVAPGQFAAVLRRHVGAWLAQGERHILLAGMVGSRQGWQEAPYLPCPAGPADLAAAISSVAFDDAIVRLVPGLSATDVTGTPEVMRGEETQLVGALPAIGAQGIACLPGSHSKWARIEAGRIAGYTTHMTGEVFAALRGHTILGRMMRGDAPPDDTAFDRGVVRAAEAGGLLHHLFGVRTLGLLGGLAEAQAASYLSGLLIGHEVGAALPPRATVHLIGAAPLCALYARAITALGGQPIILTLDAAAQGLALIGEQAGWR